MSPRKPAVLRAGGGDQTLREHLVATAARMIAEHGSADLTVRGIAREAKVADGVLYNHFADKEELLALALHAHVTDVIAHVGRAPSPGQGTVEDNLRDYITRGLAVLTRILPVFAGLISQHRVFAHFAAMPAPGTYPEHPGHAGHAGLRAALADYLRAEQQLGRLAPDARVDAAAMIIGACHELVLPRLFHGSPDTGPPHVPPGFAEDLVSTVLQGIAPNRSPAESTTTLR